ncbi:MAG: zinc ABC transporter substrate-binding protein [Candidatus Eisenbacteria bacterium]|nr:zinc ABC transporter substrate-binding protein [Candidatus Eisenbacteria bacterium]
MQDGDSRRRSPRHAPRRIRGKARAAAWLTLLVSLPIVLSLAACGGAPEPEPGRKPLVLVTVPPQAEFVEKIAGPLVEVEVLVPPDADPHTFEPTIEQMRAVSRASLYFLIGHPALEFEALWRDRLAREGTNLRFVNGSEGLSLIPDDPHVWLSPRATRTLAANLANALEELLPENKDRIQSGLQAFLDEEQELDAEIRAMLAPTERKTFLVYHAAWGWFAQDYGLTQIAIERGHVHPGPSHIASMLDRAREEGIRVVFVQPQVGTQQAESFANEIGGRVVRVDPLDRHWADNLRAAARAFSDAGTSDEGTVAK